MVTTQPHPPHPYFSGLYTFNWPQFSVHEPLIGALAVGLCLLGGVSFGHPGVGHIAGGGAMTVGMGINRRIASRSTRCPDR